MRAYAAILNARFRSLLQYRAAALAGLGTQLFWGLIRVMIFEAFYRSSTAPQPMAYGDVVTYVWLGQAFLWLLPWSTDIEIRNMIRSGTVVYELAKPLDLYTLWYVRSLALRTAPTLLRSIPLLILAGLFFDLRGPASWPSSAAFVLAASGAVVLGTAITTLLSISMLWTLSGEGVNHLVTGLVILLSGIVIPLPLFPDWAQPILNAMPFRGLMDVPFRLYTGHIPPDRAAALVLQQLGWTAALIALGRLLIARATRRLVAQGG